MTFPRAALTSIGAVAGLAVAALLAVSVDCAAAVSYATLASVPAPETAPRAAGHRPTLVVLGDSLAWGFKATPGHGWVDIFRRRLAAEEPGSLVINRSVCGSRVRDLRRQLAGLPPGTPADAVLVIAGGNDVMDATEPLRLARDEVALLSTIRARLPFAKIVVSNAPDLSWRAFHIAPGKPPVHLPLVPRVGLSVLTDVDNAVITRTARRFGAGIIDLHQLAIRGNGQAKGMTHLSLDAFDARYISDDGLHPNDRGYAVLADYAWPLIARAMGVRSQ